MFQKFRIKAKLFSIIFIATHRDGGGNEMEVLNLLLMTRLQRLSAHRHFLKKGMTMKLKILIYLFVITFSSTSYCKGNKNISLDTNSTSQKTTVTSVDTPFMLLPYSDFLQLVENQKIKIKQMEKDKDKQEIKLEMIEKVEKILKDELKSSKNNFELDIDEDLFSVQIWNLFQGDILEALKLYTEITIGQNKSNLFISSGAGIDEKISNLEKIKGSYELITDRVYKSSHAYNTKNKIRLTFFQKDPDTYICVNQSIEDYGKKLEEKGTTRGGKMYHPIRYELTIDIYKKIDPKSFQYVSFNVLHGQSTESRYATVNTAKDIGNILTGGLLGRGVDSLVKEEAESIWEKRKQQFQKMLLARKNSKS